MPMSKFKNPVIEVSSNSIMANKTVSQKVLNNRNGFLLVYSPTCPPCISMAPEFQKLAKHSKNRIAVMALDGKKHPDIYNKLPQVEGTPTMFFVNKNGNIGAEFKKERTMNQMLSFICSHIASDSSGLCPP